MNTKHYKLSQLEREYVTSMLKIVRDYPETAKPNITAVLDIINKLPLGFKGSYTKKNRIAMSKRMKASWRKIKDA